MNPKSLFDLVLSAGGFTYNLETRDLATAGFAVSTRKGFEKTYPVSEFTNLDLVDYVIRYAEVFNQPGNCLGAWVDDGLVYLDVSTVVPDAETAKALCFEHSQLAYFDLAKGETVYVNPEPIVYVDDAPYENDVPEGAVCPVCGIDLEDELDRIGTDGLGKCTKCGEWYCGEHISNADVCEKCGGLQ